jgi:hypothetical protein
VCFLFSAVIYGMADNSDDLGLKFYQAGKMNGKNFFFASTRACTQGLVLGGQVLYCMTHSNPFCVS